ncbi:MAG: hypothetical protein AAB263_18055, partial [Planctomycetota bacterium]
MARHQKDRATAIAMAVAVAGTLAIHCRHWPAEVGVTSDLTLRHWATPQDYAVPSRNGTPCSIFPKKDARDV